MKYEVLKELQLRVRGLVEEDLREKLIKILSELLEKSEEEVDKGLDQVFRLRSRYAEREGIPQDVMVNVLTQRMKEEILRQSYENPIEFKGKRVIIMRELPREVIVQRKKI